MIVNSFVCGEFYIDGLGFVFILFDILFLGYGKIV